MCLCFLCIIIVVSPRQVACSLHFFDHGWVSHNGPVNDCCCGARCSQCHVVTINCPLHPGTEHLFDEKMIQQMKPGSYLVNTARGKIVKREAVVEALEAGHLAGLS